MRSINPAYSKVSQRFTVASLANSSTAQGLVVFNRRGIRQPLQYVAPRIGFLAIDFGSLDQAIDPGAGGRALGRIAE
jgi:hypothetical protein